MVAASAMAGTGEAGSMTADDVAALRRDIYGNGVVSAGAAERLFGLARALGNGGCAEWQQLFAEAITDFLVRQTPPEGYLADENADWLMQRLGAAPGIGSCLERALLAEVMRSATQVPERFKAFAVKEMARLIRDGDHAGCQGEARPARTVTAPDVEALRTLIYASSSDGDLHVGRAEAEALFDIAEATADSPNDPGFDDLFARAIGNHVLSSYSHRIPDAGTALRTEQWLDAPDSVASMLEGAAGGLASSGATAGGLAGLMELVRSPESVIEASWAADNRADAQAGAVDAGEAHWLVQRLRRGKINSAERRLIAFLRQEAGAVPAELQTIVGQAA